MIITKIFSTSVLLCPQAHLRTPNTKSIAFKCKLETQTSAVRNPDFQLPDMKDSDLSFQEDIIYQDTIVPLVITVRAEKILKYKALLQPLVNLAVEKPKDVQLAMFQNLQPAYSLTKMFDRQANVVTDEYSRVFQLLSEESFQTSADINEWIQKHPLESMRLQPASSIMAILLCDVKEFMCIWEQSLQAKTSSSDMLNATRIPISDPLQVSALEYSNQVSKELENGTTSSNDLVGQKPLEFDPEKIHEYVAEDLDFTQSDDKLPSCLNSSVAVPTPATISLQPNSNSQDSPQSKRHDTKEHQLSLMHGSIGLEPTKQEDQGTTFSKQQSETNSSVLEHLSAPEPPEIEDMQQKLHETIPVSPHFKPQPQNETQRPEMPQHILHDSAVENQSLQKQPPPKKPKTLRKKRKSSWSPPRQRLIPTLKKRSRATSKKNGEVHTHILTDKQMQSSSSESGKFKHDLWIPC